MRVLFDNGTPRGVATALRAHTVDEARSQGWDRLRNGELLDAAEAAGFEVLLTTDHNIRYQQNLSGRKIAIVGTAPPVAGGWPVSRYKLSPVCPPTY
jgi:hypothetical protein